MAEFDLTSKVAVYLDRHLVFPLLEFISSKEIYDDNELLQAKLTLLSGTNMVDFAMDVFETLNPDEEVPENLVEKRSQVVEDLQSLQEQVDPVILLLGDEAVIKKIEESRDTQNLMKALETEHDFKPEMLMLLYKFAKLQYECGNYSGAAEYLYFVRALLPPGDKNLLNAMWGKLASEILMQNWDAAMEDLGRLKDYIDSYKFSSALMSLQQRSWLIHWSLFVYFNHQKGRDAVIDRFLYEPQYLNAIQAMCPHILRYLTTAVITSKRRRTVLKDLVRVIQQESYTYRDPITEFLECLYVNFDFDGAQRKLRECETLLTNDFFLVGCLDEFIDNARLFIFETFCRIHQCISIDMLAEKLNMDSDEAEKWIVNLIRNARLDAKIDSKLGHVVMGTSSASPYQQLIEKTKGLGFRSQMLGMNIDKRLGVNAPENVPSWGVPAAE